MVTKKKTTAKRKTSVKTAKTNTKMDLVDAMIEGEVAKKTVQVKTEKKKKKINQNYFSRALEFLGF